ncbi:MAG: hypothetical protein ABEJ60_07165 [Halodesulfurarchaeum sp.]
MPSLGETYEGRVGAASRRQVLLGTALFVAGALLLVAAILAGGTGLLIERGFGVLESREIAGVLGGIGIPAVFLGVTIVLPAARFHRAAAGIGAVIALFGVGLFRYAYPEHWYARPGVPSTIVLVLLLVYAAGLLVSVWTLFTAVATFQTRNDPGGTVSLSVGAEGPTVRAVSAVHSEVQSAGKAISSGLGGIGTFGEETDTSDLGPQPHRETGSVSDGGVSADAEIAEPAGSGADFAPSRTDDAEVLDESTRGPDRYCGNCTHFEYADTDGEMAPYCGLTDETMEDMSACQWWENA